MPPDRKGSRCLTCQEQVASYTRALVVIATMATTLRAAVLLRRMSLSRSRVLPGVCTKAHEGVNQGCSEILHCKSCYCLWQTSFSLNWPCTACTLMSKFTLLLSKKAHQPDIYVLWPPATLKKKQDVQLSNLHPFNCCKKCRNQVLIVISVKRRIKTIGWIKHHAQTKS